MKDQSFTIMLLALICSISQTINSNPTNTQCPIGYTHPTPTFNGCGSETKNGFKLAMQSFQKKITIFDFTKCCNAHDICYGTCGSDKNICESHFKSCMKGVCDPISWTKRQLCKAKAFGYYHAVDKLGHTAFDKAQENNCKCIKIEEETVKHKENTQENTGMKHETKNVRKNFA